MKSPARFSSILLMLPALACLLFVMPAAAQFSLRTTAKVMTYNVDEGTDFGAIIGVLTNTSSTDFATAVQQTVAEVENSDPAGRAQRLADEIAAAQPDLVGLQEVALWNIQGLPIDMLQLILARLAADGQNYTAVVTVPEFQINIAFPEVGFMDREVILARADEPSLTILRTGQGHYNAQIPLPAFPPYLPAGSITRGWGYVDARLNGVPFRFITTHLEDGTNPISLFALVQALQEIQLVYSPAFTLLPVIIGGDFNTVANDPTSPTFLTYQFMLANGFTDAWSKTHGNAPGPTCCQEDLGSSNSELSQRIDLVFTRNRVSALAAQRVGDQPVNGFWPSDHAGLNTVEAISRIF